MDKLRIAWACCAHNFKKWTINPKIYVLFALMLVYNSLYITPVADFVTFMGIKIVPWGIFPMLTTFPISEMVLLLGIIFLLSDAPFIDDGQTYLILRSGRIPWGMGQILYIILSAGLYLLITALIGMFLLFPNYSFIDKWGKAFGTLAQTDARLDFDLMLNISNKIQILYKPSQAFLNSFLLNWCAGTILGLVIFLINLNTQRNLGFIFASMIILYDVIVVDTLPLYYGFFSPVSLARLDMLITLDRLVPWRFIHIASSTYSYVVLLLCIAILSLAALWSVKRQIIQTNPRI